MSSGNFSLAYKLNIKRQANPSALFKHKYKLEITVHNSESKTCRCLPPGSQVYQPNEMIICVYILNKIICPNHFQSWVQSVERACKCMRVEPACECMRVECVRNMCEKCK